MSSSASDAVRQLALVRAELSAAFEPHGPVAAVLGDYSPRASQVELAQAVLDAIAERGTLVAEAGTGTGKTFAYLVPALLAGGKVLVSTATRALQDQIFDKDLASIARALGLPLRFAMLKGRQNYLCLHRLERTQSQGLLATFQDVGYLRLIERFARTSATGDRVGLAKVPENASIWPAVTSTRENCLGAECPRFDACFVYQARRAAQAADVVVVNHHLFLADLALRDDAIREFLPTVDTVILDEAHQLPRIAAEFFGAGWSLAQLTDLAHDARAAGLAGDLASGAPWVALTQAVEAAGRVLRLSLAQAGLQAGGRIALDRLEGSKELEAALTQAIESLAALAAALEVNTGRAPDLDAMAPRTAALSTQIDAWRSALRQGEEEEPKSVRWIAASAHGAQFQTTPLAPGEAFARVREQNTQAWILTSATLTVAGRFDGFLREIGLPQADTRRWDSPFDFPQQGLLYLPKPLPIPNTASFARDVADAAWPVIEASGGRAFVLCSTLRAVDLVAARLREHLDRAGLDLPLLVQGTSTRPALLDTFRRAGNAVLVGSVSFWEGIDVRGEALSVVVIDKLPFAPPDDPVVEARIRRLRALGRNPFLEFQLPQAVMLLKQGAGRLIRGDTERGVLMILDERLLSKPYGRTVLASLPPFGRSRRLADVLAFLAASTPAA